MTIPGVSLPSSEQELFDEANESLANAEWSRALNLFRELVGLAPLCAEAWDGLATAAYWIPDEEAILQARERAYHLYRERGDSLRAARMAGWLAVDNVELRGLVAVGKGWMLRARRLLDKNRDAPESAWVTVYQGRLLMITGADASRVRRTAAEAAAMARRLSMPDAEALALAMEGHARLDVGDMDRAVRCLDEAATVVLSREAGDITAVALTLCSLMGACERTRDFDRARQWCAVARQFSEDHGFPVILSICRPHYGAVLMWRGQWPEAEEHLQKGSRELTEFMPPFAVGALALLASLRCRQGRWEEAEEIFEQIRNEPPAQLGIAELLATRDDSDGAIDVLQRRLRELPSGDKLERGPALELLIRCLSAAGRVQEASECLEELRRIAEAIGTTSLRGMAALAEGILAHVEARAEQAEERLRDAVILFERAGAPFESAQARVALAKTLHAGGQLDAAACEAQIAEEALLRVGAAREAERAAELRATITARRASDARTPDGLTEREQEVLALLATGVSNQQIASDLVLSVRTVERHISNIYQKLNLEGRTARAAAAAHAYRSQNRRAASNR